VVVVNPPHHHHHHPPPLVAPIATAAVVGATAGLVAGAAASSASKSTAQSKTTNNTTVVMYQQQPGYYPPPPPQAQARPDLWAWFSAVDTDRSGKIKPKELQKALSNGMTEFNIETVQLLMNLFDNDHSGQISFDEFVRLFDFVNQWRNTFMAYDRDRSGSINFHELKTALTNFGYRLSDRFYNLIMVRFTAKPKNEVNFDNFIRVCVLLDNITKNFQVFDTNRTGVINISFEQFTEVFFSIV